MFDFGSLSPAETLELLASSVSGLTLYGREIENGPTDKLRSFINFVADGELRSAAEAYSGLTTMLLTCGARRISGSIWQDYILDLILLNDGTFARAAAEGRMDNALLAAVRSDLALLERLFGLNEEVLAILAREKAKELSSKGRMPADTASAIATAAWGGGAIHHVPKENQYRQQTGITSFKHVFSWKYGEFEITDSYWADEALEGMYRRFIGSDDWGSLADDLWNFHAAYGFGEFLRYRNFRFDGRLSPLPDLRPGDFVQLADAEYGKLLNNAIAFMRDESAHPMLLLGGHGMGKTTMMLELTDELPKLRLVYVTGGLENAAALFDTLKQQPQKFMVLVDDLRVGQENGICEPILPMNVLFAACSCDTITRGLFEVTVSMPNLQLNEFVETVAKLLESKELFLPVEVIRSACVDYQVDTRCEFTFAAAARIAQLLQS